MPTPPRSLLLFLLASASLGPAQAQTTPADSVTATQGAGGYNSLTDGQPGSPGVPAFSAMAARLPDTSASYQTALSYTPRARMLQGTLLGLVVPTLNVGEGANDFERSASVTWLQRWAWQRGARPTFSTQVAFQFPYDEPGTSIDAVVTAVLARSFGGSTAYLNGYVETQDGLDFDALEWGLLAGIKRPVSDALFVVGDVLYQTGGPLTAELSAAYSFKSGFGIGPGLGLGFDLDGGPVTWGAGLVLTYSR